MKRFLVVLFLSVAVIFPGCITEEWSNCRPEDNCILLFRYSGPAGEELFDENIGNVHIALFDGQMAYRGHWFLNSSDLRSFRGIRLQVPPGDYYAVCWGNVNTDGYLLGGDSMSNMTSLHLWQKKTSYEQPLFYTSGPEAKIHDYGPEPGRTPCLIRVPSSGIAETSMDFIRAQRNVRVFVKNYETETGQADSELNIKIEHVPCGYDFFLNVDPLEMDFIETTRPLLTPEGIMPGAAFMTPYHEINDNIYITVTQHDNKTDLCPPINLKEHLKADGISLDPLSLDEIDIILEFTGGELTVTLPDWGNTDVLPEL